MSIKRTIITTVVALALVALVAPVIVQADTLSDLMAQIASLTAQLNALKGTTGTQTAGTGGTGACTGITFTRNMTVGATGSDVKCLQQILNQSASTQVSVSGAGSPGNETSYFGAKTLVAVKKYQANNGLTPANQVGPLTRAKLNAALGTTGGGTTPPPVVTPTGAGLQVMVAYDNPASGTLVSGATSTDGQGGADLAHFTFVNGDNAPVKVTSLKLNRIGISQDTLLANVYLYQGASRLTDSAGVSSGLITFNNPNGLFTVPSGGSITIRVLADIYYGMSGETVGVSVASVNSVVTNASSVTGNFPVTGNLQNTASATLATVSFTTGTSGTTPTGGNVDPQNDYVVWSNTATVSTRTVTLSRFALYQTGSVSATDIQNYRLYVDGVQVGSAVQSPDSNGYITFDLTASPATLQTGARTIKVIANIVAGSSKTFAYSLRQVSDALFTDSQIGVGVQPTVGGSAFTQLKSCYVSSTSYACTINSGTVTIAKTADSPSGNITLSSPNAVIGRYTLTAAGEPVKITDLYVYIYESAAVAYLRNGALYANGAQIGSTANIATNTTSTAGTHFTLGSSLIVSPGSPVTLEVRADIHEVSSTAVASGQTLYAVIVSTASNAEAQVSKSSITTPAANVSGNTLTVKTGSLTLSKLTAYTDQITVAPLTAYKIAHFTLSNDTVEPINISTIEGDVSSGVAGILTNLYIKYGNQTTTVKPTVATVASGTSANSWSVNYQLPASTSVDVMVYGDVSSAATAGAIQASVEFCGTTANSATAVYTGAGSTCSNGTVAGQSISFSSGTLTEQFAGTPTNQIVAGNQSVDVAKFTLISSYQNYTVTEMHFTANSNSGAIVSASLKDASGAVLQTVSYNNYASYFNFNALNILVPASTSKTVTLSYNLSIPSATASTSGVDTKAVMTDIKYQDPNGTVTESTPTVGTNTANTTLVYRSLPTMTQVPLNTSGTQFLVNNGVYDLYKFTVAAPTQGEVDVKQFKLALLWTDGGSSGDTLQLNSLKLLKDGVDITSSVSMNDQSGTNANGVSEGSSALVVTWLTNTQDAIQPGTSTTYTIRGTPNGWNSSDNSTFAHPDSMSIGFTSDTTFSSSDGTTAGTLYNYLNIGTTAATTGILKLYSSATASGSAQDEKLIWSDSSAVAHSAAIDQSATQTKDWYNGYLMPNVPAQAWQD